MKKVWQVPSIEVLDVRETAFGPFNSSQPDSEKTQITINGVTGWQQFFGESNPS